MRPHVAELARLAGHLHGLPSQRRPAQRVRRLRPDAGRDRATARPSSPPRAWSTSSAAAAAPPQRTSPRSPPRCRACPAAVPAARPGRGPGSAAWSRSRSARDTGFVMIGERTNVTGSARFRRLIEADDHQGAVDVALEQVRGGANLLDVNMDADLLDSEQAMTTFLNLIATEPEVARIPIMIDSSRWSVLEAGLKCVQGKGVVNSISLKEGEEPFLEQARRIRELRRRRGRDGLRRAGPGRHRRAQGVDLRPGLRPAHPAGRLPAEDIIFDPNVLAVATGIAEHNGYAKAFIDALPLIKERCPGVADQWRHLEPVVLLPRQRRRPRGDALGVPAITRSGPAWTWASSTPASSRSTQDIPADLLELVEDVLFDRRPDATDRLVDLRRDAVSGAGYAPHSRPVLARGAGRAAADARPRARHRRLHRGRHRGGPAAGGPPPRRHRGPADGRHEDRRRPVRRREDVPAAGGEERPGDEARRSAYLEPFMEAEKERPGRGPGRANAARARSCWPPSRATCTTSARTSSASCSAATTTRSSTSA